MMSRMITGAGRFCIIACVLWIGVIAFTSVGGILNTKIPEVEYILVERGMTLKPVGSVEAEAAIASDHVSLGFPTGVTVYAPPGIDKAAMERWGFAFYKDQIRPREALIAALRRHNIMRALAWSIGGVAFFLLLGGLLSRLVSSPGKGSA
jgi:hypothetical protein